MAVVANGGGDSHGIPFSGAVFSSQAQRENCYAYTPRLRTPPTRAPLPRPPCPSIVAAGSAAELFRCPRNLRRLRRVAHPRRFSCPRITRSEQCAPGQMP